MSDKYIPRLKALYNDEIVKNLEKDLNIDNINKLPKLEKVIISCGVGKKREDTHFTETVALTLEKIAGQAPISRLAKKSIASFKIRKGMGAPVGYLVTLRNDKMYEFVDRFISIALPHVRDFTAYLQIHSICKVITQLALKNKPSSQKSLSKMLQFYMVSKLLLLSRMAPKKVVASY